MTRNRNHNRTTIIFLYSKNTRSYPKHTKIMTNKLEFNDFLYKIAILVFSTIAYPILIRYFY